MLGLWDDDGDMELLKGPPPGYMVSGQTPPYEGLVGPRRVAANVQVQGRVQGMPDVSVYM